MKLITTKDLLQYEIESFAKDYSKILEKHSSLMEKVASSKEAKNLLKKEILASLF